MGIRGISSTRYDCEGQIGFNSICIPSPTGQYANLTTCQQACSDKWMCVDGNCFVHPQGTLTYTQCKATCVVEDKYSCEQGQQCYLDPNGTMTLDECEKMCTRWTCESAGNCLPNPNGQYLTEQSCLRACPRVTIPCTVIEEGCEDYRTYLNDPAGYPLTLQQLLDSWVINLALPQMGGYVVTPQQVLDLFQRCCVSRTPPTLGTSTQRQGRGRGRKIGYSNFTSAVFEKPIVPALVMGMVIGVGLFASYQITKSLKL